LNRRVLGVVAAILLAAAGTWVLVQYVSKADERAEADQELVAVLVVDEAIAQGTPVAVAQASMSTKLVRADDRAPGALENLDSVRGLVTSIDFLPGDQVSAARFIAAEVLLDTQLTVDVPEGLLELTVLLTAERSVGGTLKPGDKVAVLSSFDPFTLDAVEPTNPDDLNQFLQNDGTVETITLTTPNSTGISVHKALVTRVQVTEAPAEEAAAQPAGVDVAPATQVLVTMAVAPGDAEQIIFTAEYGAIWLARETQTAPEEDPVLIITRANVYR